MSTTPAAQVLRRSARLLYEQALVIKRSHSVGGVGRIWPRGARAQELRYHELLGLSYQLRAMSAALSRTVVLREQASRAVLVSMKKAA